MKQCDKHGTLVKYYDECPECTEQASSDNGDLLSVGDQSCLVFAARYAHTRETGAANMVVTTLLAHWDRLIPETQAQLKREAANEATCNKDDWQRLIDR